MTEHIIALITLTIMEIVLGIDNIVFIAILTGKLPKDQQAKTQRMGLLAAMIMRVAMLGLVQILAGLTAPLVTLFGHGLSARDLIMLAGGLFLIAKATFEIHENLEGKEHDHDDDHKADTVKGAVIQILLLDLVFSIDSVITAVGMSDNFFVMAAAVVIAIFVMMAFAQSITRFIQTHPTLKMLALSFLLLIGVMLTFEGFGGHMEKGYIYFAMGFSIFVELLNMRLRKVGASVRKRLRQVGGPINRPEKQDS